MYYTHNGGNGTPIFFAKDEIIAKMKNGFNSNARKIAFIQTK